MPGPSGPSPKLLGLLAALTLACVFGAVLWFSRTPAANQPVDNDNLFPDSQNILDINELSTSEAMIVTMADKLDPTRIASTLAADRFEPIGNGQRRLDHPIAWIYQRDGRAMKIEADTATVMMPDPNQPPIAGTMEGNVSVRFFASTPAPGTPAADDAVPTMIAQFDAPVEFERQYLRLRSQGRFTIVSEQIDFAGHDLTVMLNEVRDRIELIDIRKGEQLVIHPKAKDEEPSSPEPIQTDTPASDAPITVATTKPTTPTTTTAPSTPAFKDPQQPVPQDPPAITRYQVTFADEVLARVVGTGSASADSLDIWALFEDGQLRDNAIAQVAIAQSETVESENEPPKPKPAHQGTEKPESSESPKPVTKPVHASGDLVITWTGPLTVRPLEDNANPSQLSSSDLTIEMNAKPGSSVAFNAPARGVTGTADHVGYHATTATLLMHADEESPSPTTITIAEGGSIITNSIEASLLTGHIAINSGGIIETTPADAPGAELTWKDSASFDIAINNDGSLSNRLQLATFSGIVQGRQDGNQVAGSVITATFDPTAPPQSSLRKLSFVNGVLISNTKATLGGGLLDIDFASGSMGYELDPIRVAADGSVIARSDGQILRAEELDITLARDLAGKTFARTANARTDVRYTGKNRTNAKGDSFEGDGVREQLTLLGTPTTPASVTQGGSTITGNHIDLNAHDRRLEVVGPGTFDHDVALDDPSSNGHLRVRWKGSMRFDDALGSILCEDSVTAVSTPDAYTKDTLSAHRIEIDITPMPIAEPIRGQPMPRRELLIARAYGQIMADLQAVPAKIESRTYAVDDPERVIGLLYLEGPQLFANNRNQTLTIPAPGTLLLMDRTAQADSTNASGPGLTKFTWQGRMDLDRAAGNATMRDTVVVNHKSLSDGQTMTLTCDTIDAGFELASQSGGANLLRSADAIGSVVFRSQTRQLLADTARFNAINETVFAAGENGNLVTLYDTNQPAPVSAQTLLWDLARDRIEINAPTPVRSPSGP